MSALLINHKFSLLLEKVQLMLMCLFVGTLCTEQEINHAFLIATLFVSLFLFDRELLRSRLVLMVLMILVYLTALASATYSSNSRESLFVLEKQMTLFLVPVIFGFSFRATLEKLSILIYAFMISIFLACAYLLLVFYQHYLIIRDILPFQFFLNTKLHHHFSAPLRLHATYLSLYVCFAIACSIYFLFNAKTVHKITVAIFLPVFLVSLALLSSRITFVPFGIIVTFILPFFIKKRALAIYMLLLVTVGSISGYLLAKSPAFKERFKTDTLRELNIAPDKNKIFNFKNITESNDATRAERWKCAVELIQEKPIIGYGTGDEKAQLEKKYIKYKLTNSTVNNFDSHNQYLAYMIKSGIFGLLAYLILLGLSLWIALKKKNYFLLSFITIIVTTSLTENILESNKGILFFAFFNSVLVYSASCFPLRASLLSGRSDQ